MQWFPNYKTIFFLAPVMYFNISVLLIMAKYISFLNVSKASTLLTVWSCVSQDLTLDLLGIRQAELQLIITLLILP
jgi:hypothetical protein